MAIFTLDWVLCAVALGIGCWVQTAAGFGMAVIAAPIMVLVEPGWVPVVLTVTALVLSLLNTWNQRSGLQLNELSIAFLTRIPGTIVGTWLLLQINVVWLQVLVSACVLLAVIVSLLGPQFEATRGRLGLAGFVSGITGTTTSIGGPPMALVMQHGAPLTVRANLSMYFTYSCLISLIGYAWAGLLNRTLMLESLSFIPCALGGFLFGQRARVYVDAGRFRIILLLMCGLSGLTALAGVLWRLLQTAS